MKSLSLLLATTLIGLGSLVPSMAGTPAISKAPVLPPVSGEPAFSAEFSLGYDTFYIFRGEELFEQVVWGQVELNYALTDKLSFTLTPWYLAGIEDDFTELDLLPAFTFDAGFAELKLGYAGYFYPRGSFGGNEGIDDEHEINFTVAKNFGIFEASTLAAYNFDRDGTYLEARIGAPIELCKAAALEPSVAVGYSSHYFAEDGITHVLLSLAMPVKLCANATLTPYVAGNIPLDVLDETQDAELFGGVALAFSF
jgi:hypothetical protein